MPYDPSKNIKVKQQLAQKVSNIGAEWPIKKPSDFDFFTIFGSKVEDLDVVYTLTQRQGNGEPKTFIIQAEDNELEEILKHVGETNVKTAVVCPYYTSANGKFAIWMAKQPSIGTGRTHDVHLQIKNEIIPNAQSSFVKMNWDSDAMRYTLSKPENQEIFQQPNWNKDEVIRQVGKSINDILIETPDHEVVKRARGLIQ